MKLTSKIATILIMLLIGTATVSYFVVQSDKKTLISRIDRLECAIASLENENREFDEKINKKIDEVKEDFDGTLEIESDYLKALIDIVDNDIERVSDDVDRVRDDVSYLQVDMHDIKDKLNIY